MSRENKGKRKKRLEVLKMSKKKLDRAAAEARRAYFREWRRKNIDKVKQYNDDYWRRQAEKRLAEEVNTNGSESTKHDDRT